VFRRFVEASSGDYPKREFELSVTTGACLAAATATIVRSPGPSADKAAAYNGHGRDRPPAMGRIIG
jgi:hypothetical protein